MLLVDADPQASLSQGLLGPEVARAITPVHTIAAIFDEAGEPPIRKLILPGFVPADAANSVLLRRREP